MAKYRKGLLLLLVAGVLLLTGCSMEREIENSVPDRFEVVYEQADARIIKDAETGEKYLFVKVGYGAGLTALQE